MPKTTICWQKSNRWNKLCDKEYRRGEFLKKDFCAGKSYFFSIDIVSLELANFIRESKLSQFKSNGWWQFQQHFTLSFFVSNEAFLFLHLRFELLGCKNIGINALIKYWWNWPVIYFFSDFPWFLRFYHDHSSFIRIRSVLNVKPCLTFAWKLKCL